MKNEFPAIYPFLGFEFGANHIKEVTGLHCGMSAYSESSITFGMADALDRECKCVKS